MSTIPLAIIGLGAIGRLCAEIALERNNLAIVGAADLNPELAGRDLGQVLGRPVMGLKVEKSLEEALAGASKGVALLTTTSSLAETAGQIEACLAAGWRVVSTCEELIYPFFSQPELAGEIDAAAKKAGLAVLGTGVNPGFAMDALPAYLSGVMRRVESVLVERFQDAATRRLPFQKKIGVGLSPDEFQAKAASGAIRHVGFRESIDLIAAAWGIELTRGEEKILPVMAAAEITSPHLSVAPGQVAGVDQIARGFLGEKPVITLHLQAYFGHPEPAERIVIKGEPPLEMVIKGGLPGDVATCARTVNAVSRLIEAPPGLRTVLDMGACTCPHCAVS